ncbi:MAG: tRNA (adenosine(37)-N6)-dimethylallyltransferase MiaA [Proteobacteria bacterium]|nr:tRNA (adenosine(37)-N6)-dimethylallyltransferase MiaA [Pseudomonadota bacterium]
MIIKVIIGPTASGKSALAVERAKSDNGTIINADAMQCYDALPILTAQPTQKETAGIPHVLYSVLASTERMSAADWVVMSTREIQSAFKLGRTPYLVGGTGMYIKALMDGLSPMPDISPEIRANVRSRIDTEGLPSVYADLQKRDPTMAAKLKAGDTQRILRAMEVLEATGKSLAEWQAIPLQKPPADWRFHVTVINPPKEILETKIRKRLEAMLNNGVMDEVASLSKQIEDGSVPEDAPITVAHGFKYLRRVLKNELLLPDAVEATAIETRQYTKRQRTWLRNQIAPDEVL